MERLHVATLQTALPDRQTTVAAWARWLEGCVLAARSGADELIVLPAHAGGGPEWAHTGVPAQDAWPRYLAWGTALARLGRVWLVPGSAVVREGGTLRHRACLFDPTGEPTAAWSQWMYTPSERRAGFAPPELPRQGMPDPGLTTLGPWRIGGLLGHDVASPELGRWLRLAGVDLIVGLRAVPAPRKPWQGIAEAWAVVQENQFFLAEAMLAGTLHGAELAAESAVWAPCEISPEEQGWLVQAAAGSGPSIVAATCDRAELVRLRNSYDLMHYLNRPLYRAQWGRP